jgi:hypothetical protein
MQLIEPVFNEDSWRDRQGNPGSVVLPASASAAVSRESVPEERLNVPACRSSDQMGIRDPLTMPPVSGKTDAAAAAAETSDSGREPNSLGLSQVLGKILQQLSISAWVPAAMLVGNGAVLLQLHAARNFNIAAAVKELTAKPLGTVIILAFALVLTTVVTQAFEFEVIRFLEGYFDSDNGLIQAIMAWRIRRHEAKRKRFEIRLRDTTIDAREQAAQEMRQFPGYDLEMLDYLARMPAKNSEEFDPGLDEKVQSINWMMRAPSAIRYRLASIDARFQSYPRARLLPTRLGNVLRAAEDKVTRNRGENLQGFVIRHLDELPPALQSQHKEYRTRLDMYCCLTVAFSVLVAISVVVLRDATPIWGVLGAVVIYALLACLSYQAAIATARAYGLILLEISRYVDRQEELGETAEPSAFNRLLALLHRNAV